MSVNNVLWIARQPIFFIVALPQIDLNGLLSVWMNYLSSVYFCIEHLFCPGSPSTAKLFVDFKLGSLGRMDGGVCKDVSTTSSSSCSRCLLGIVSSDTRLNSPGYAIANRLETFIVQKILFT